MQAQKLKPQHIGQINQTWNKAIRKKVCMHPESPLNCSSTYGKAHSIQKSQLKKIAKGGKVLKIGSDPMTGIPRIQSVGIKKASTFYGFCNYHDDKLFAPIEKKPLVLKRETALLLTFRAMSIHMYYKRRRKETNMFGKLQKNTLRPDVIQHDKLVRLGLDRLLQFAEPAYKRMGQDIVGNKFVNAYYVALIFDRIPDILCSEASLINFGFDGDLVRPKPQPYDFLTLSLLPYQNDKGIALFAWHRKSKTNQEFLKTLLSLGKQEFPDAVVRFVFSQLKNFFIAPNWWDNLSAEQNNSLMKKFTNLTVVPGLAADGKSYVNWKVTDIKTSLKL